MKIKSDNGVLIIPNEVRRTILVNRNKEHNISECFDSYINKGKKTSCLIYDEDGKALTTERLSYISIPNDISIDNNLNFKPKSLLNISLQNLINENDLMFKGIEKIRDVLKEFTYDDGMYKIKRILSSGISETDLEIGASNFNLDSLLQLYYLHSKNYDEETYILMIYNLLIYLNRNNFIILYIRNRCGKKTFRWLETLDKERIMVFVDNEAIKEFKTKFDILITGTDDHLETLFVDSERLLKIPFLLNPIVLNNIHLLNEENIELIRIFESNNSSFLVKNLV